MPHLFIIHKSRRTTTSSALHFYPISPCGLYVWTNPYYSKICSGVHVKFHIIQFSPYFTETNGGINGHLLSAHLCNRRPVLHWKEKRSDHLWRLNSLICYYYEKNGIWRDAVAGCSLPLIASLRFTVHPSNCCLDDTIYLRPAQPRTLPKHGLYPRTFNAFTFFKIYP